MIEAFFCPKFPNPKRVKLNIMKNIAFISSLLLVFILVASCGQEKEDTLALITVKDANNKIVSGVTVILEGESTTNQSADVVLRDTVKSDLYGVATFDYTERYKLGQAGFAVLNIRAEAKDGSGAILKGEGTIKIEPQEVNTEAVYIQ